MRTAPPIARLLHALHPHGFPTPAQRITSRPQTRGFFNDLLGKREKLGEAIRQHWVIKEVDKSREQRPYAGISESFKPWEDESSSASTVVMRQRRSMNLEKNIEEVLDLYVPIPEGSEQDDGEAKEFRYVIKKSLSRIWGYFKTLILELFRAPKLPDNLIMHISANPGFLQHDRNRQPQDFNLWRLAVDATLPVIDLHAYNQYFPVRRGLRGFMMLQRVFGWWLLTSFLASLAVL